MLKISRYIDNGLDTSKADCSCPKKKVSYDKEKINYVENGSFTSKKSQLGRKKRSFVQRSGRRVEMDRLRRTWVVYVEKRSFVLKMYRLD